MGLYSKIIASSNCVLQRRVFIAALCFISLSNCKPRKKSQLASVETPTYSFGGACGTRGFWTQTAIGRSQEIIATIERLRDNPKCVKVYESLNNLKDIQEKMTPPENSGHRFSRMMSLTREITTLNSYIGMSDFKRGDVLALLLDRTIELKTLNTENLSEMQAVSSIKAADAERLAVARNAAESVAGRMLTSSQVGLDRLQKYYQALEESAECVNDNPALVGGTLMTQSAQVLGAFASGDPVTASKAGTAINSFSKMLRQSKYNSALMKAKESVFAESIGCMVEAVEYSYCAARDGQAILNRGADQLQKKLSGGRAVADPSSPFYGYFVMSHHLPIIAKWLDTVMGGYIPLREVDTKRINAVLQIPIDIEAYNVELLSIYSERMRNFLQTTDEVGKASLLLSLVRDLNKTATNASFPKTGYSFGSDGNDKIPNFFNQSGNSLFFQFKLLGFTPDDIPKACIDGTLEAGGKALSFEQWAVATDKGFQPHFFRFDLASGNDKDESGNILRPLPGIIKDQMQTVVKEARAAASVYFWNNLPVDLDAVAASAGMGVIGSAMSSLEAVRLFLLDLMVAGRVENTLEAKMNLLSLKDAYQRIADVQDAYAKYTANPTTENTKSFIATVYDRLNLVFQGNSFLSHRLIGFVKRDLVKSVTKNKLGVNGVETEVLLAAGDLAFEQILQSLGTGTNDVETGKNQFALARTMNSEALAAIDSAFGDKLISVIAYYKQIATGRGDTSAASVFIDSFLRSKMDSRILPRLKGDTFVDRFVNMSLDSSELTGVQAYIRRSLNPDLYPMPNPWQGPGYGEDEFGSYGTYWATLCALTLALPNPARYADVCDGSILYSPFEDRVKNGVKKVGPLSMAYSNWRKNFHTNPDSGIYPTPQCAFYDISRRNQIYTMTLDHMVVGGAANALVPLPSDSGLGDREFVLNDMIPDPVNSTKAVASFVKRKIGKVPTNTTYCSNSGVLAPKICGEYEQRLTSRGAKNAGSVALPCYDLKGQTFFCCNGSYASLTLPDSGGATCYKSLTDNSAVVKTLTDADLSSP